MKNKLMAALALTALLAGCAPQLPLQTQARLQQFGRSPAAMNPKAPLTLRSDEGLRKGVLELRKIRFQKWDTNVSGFLTRDEVTDQQMALPGVIDGFADYDANSDGKIYLEEFLREDTIAFWMEIIRTKIDVLFDKHDLDHNRVITANENAKLKLFFSPWPKLNGGDLNNDGVVTFSEFEDAYMEVLPFFQQTGDQNGGLPSF